MAIMLKAIYRFNAIPTKIPAQFLLELKRAILKCICNKKITQDSKTILNKIKISGGFTIPNLKQYKKTIEKMHGIVTEMGQVDHWSKIEELEITPHAYGLLNFEKSAKESKCEKTAC